MSAAGHTLRKRRRWLPALAVLLAGLVVAAWLFHAQGGLAPLRVPVGEPWPGSADPEQIAQGAYLARIGNCLTCHTTRGGTPYAGGRAFRSEYGVLYSGNLTPDPETGLGDWSLAEFRHTLRHGVSRTGLLYPAFPFAHYRHLTDADIAALFAFLQQLPPVRQAPPDNVMSAPSSWRNLAMLGWRMLFHRPAREHLPAADEAPRSQAWERGRYLVEGVGHCAMCHSGRGPMQSLPDSLYMAGEHITGQGWYAPPLDRQALSHWQEPELAAFLRHGVSRHGSAYGSMAEVVYTSTQFLTEQDALAMAVYLKTIEPAAGARPDRRWASRDPASTGIGNGMNLYRQHCAGCHGLDGRGRGLDFPPLAGNRLVTSPSGVNPIRMVLFGGAAPVTAGNRRPYSMPPYITWLSDREVAEVVNYIRSAWGNQASAVTIDDVRAQHSLMLH